MFDPFGGPKQQNQKQSDDFGDWADFEGDKDPNTED